MKTKYLGLAVAVLCLFLGGTGIAAQIIEVVNHSFELDLTGTPNQTKRDLSEVLGWIEGLDNGSGVEPLENAEHPERSFTGTGDGLMKAYGLWDYETGQGDWFYQILDHQIVAGEQYQMTFAYGVSSVETPVIASFIDGSTMAELASVTVSTATRWVFEDYTLELSVPSDASYAGHNLGVKFRIGQRPPSYQYDGWASVDNVRVQMGINEPPQVNAGVDVAIDLPSNTVTLDGTVTDDGEPNPPGSTTVLWEKVSGPESYSITDSCSVDTTVTFSASGYYIFRLTANDGLLSASDEMMVTVYMPGGVMTNEGEYPNNEIPRYAKFEATLRVETVAENPQLPYDAAPPAGLRAGIGVSVDVEFTPDDWQTVYTQPAFYYKDMEYKSIGNQDWWHPTGAYFWKVRFSPNKTGVWKYKYTVQDAAGTTLSDEMQFVVCESDKKGFIKVSQKDARYFEFDNGEHFIGLGHNIRFGQLNWDNPVKTNTTLFQKLNENGTQLFRSWLSHWSIYGSCWSPWNSPLNAQHALDPPWTGLSMWNVDPNSEVCLRLSWTGSPAMFTGWLTGKRAPVKRNTNYRFSVRYHTVLGVEGPRIAGYPYGVVLKVSDSWLDDNNNDIYKYCDPDALRTDGKIVTVVTSYGTEGGQWSTVEGVWNSGNRDFLPYIYVVLENVTGVYQGLQIDKIEICEELGNGEYGPCILGKSWFAYHYYMDQHKSWAFDKVIELAEEYDIYLKLVLMEKQDWIMTRIAPAGYISDIAYANYFYGQYRTVDKGRWLQQAWWRYCQARWGYSPHVHSWETCNEADPQNSRHYTQVDEMAIYMHQFGNKHLVTTSFWFSFPDTEFWANTSYPNVDYADLHRYDQSFTDYADSTRTASERYGAFGADGAGKPLIRGETGFFNDASEADSDGIYIHNYAWGQVNPGGMYDLYWDNNNEFQASPDPRRHYKPLRNFLDDIPLNNGDYQAVAAAVVTVVPPDTENLRAWGQKDLVRGNAHVWMQNKKHTSNNLRDGVTIPNVSGTVTVGGFVPGRRFEVQWWDTYQSDKAQQVTNTQTFTADGAGEMTFNIDNMYDDVAVKICSLASDINGNGNVDGYDLQLFANQWLWTGTAGAINEDIVVDGVVDFVDFAELARNF